MYIFHRYFTSTSNALYFLKAKIAMITSRSLKRDLKIENAYRSNCSSRWSDLYRSNTTMSLSHIDFYRSSPSTFTRYSVHICCCQDAVAFVTVLSRSHQSLGVYDSERCISVESQKSYIGHLKPCISKYKILGISTYCQLVLRLDV